MSNGPEESFKETRFGDVMLTWDDSEVESNYANIATATASREEFFLLFGTHQNWQGKPGDGRVTVKLSDRMILSPFAAKRLQLVLSQTVAAYEERFGTIKV
ncbi:MAG: DUF3467 domain-containing protein [Minwuia sp.]|uniref:DUF3467 domain-containing protein n=1 Tax=Minwuia sp. TaxID=2493630 RepID=UPI003A8C297D